MATRHGTTGDDFVDASLDNQTTAFLDFGIGKDHVTGTNFNDAFFMSVDAQSDTINGGGGEDRVDYSASDRGLQIDLQSGSVTGLFGNLLKPVAGLSSIEDVTGSHFDDTISGDTHNNTLDGGLGNDTIDGRGGIDTVSFTSWDSMAPSPGQISPQKVAITLGDDTHDGSATRSLFSAPTFTYQTLEHDTLRNIENVQGSNLAESINGNAQDNYIDGRGGNDTIDGGLGNDILDGGAGINTVSFASRVGTATSGEQDLIVLGQHGTDGAAEIFEHLEIPNQTILTEHDTLRNFSNVNGSGHDESISGNELDNVFNGNGGKDTISGGDGNDTINGGDGDDRLMGNAGADTLTGGAGHDNFLFFSANDSRPGAGHFDTITDFQQGSDVLNFVYMDANGPLSGQQTLILDAGSGPLGVGHIHDFYDAQRNVTVVEANTAGQGQTPDFHLELTGHITLTASDFLL